MDYMRERGAVSPETAVSPAEVGMDNPNLMYVFLHSHKVEKTPEGLFYLLTDYKDIYERVMDEFYKIYPVFKIDYKIVTVQTVDELPAGSDYINLLEF